MLYHTLRFLVRFSLHFYIKRIGWEGVENIPKNKPILFAPTHSNSFLDALYLAAFFENGVYCLARGDAFAKPKINRLLRHLKLLPIFRQSDTEGDTALKNQQTFEESHALFGQNEHVLIFPEGICKHQTEVLPLKRGVTTIVQKAWADNLDVHIVPVSISYTSLTDWGKKCDIVFGKSLKSHDFTNESPQENSNQILQTLHTRLSENFPTTYNYQGKNTLWGWFGQMLYFVGWFVHFPLYWLVQSVAKRLTKGTVFYDSVAIGLLSVALPFYYLIIGVGIYFCSKY
jgi:1-acyl-sn-glycerol-3-phosphate acyltransferase